MDINIKDDCVRESVAMLTVSGSVGVTLMLI